MTRTPDPMIDIDDHTEGVRVVAVGGSLDVFNAGTLSSLALSGLPSGAHEVIIDLREAEFLDTAGLSAIVRVYQQGTRRELVVRAALAAESSLHPAVCDALRALVPCDADEDALHAV
jgi:anti-anti-sigma factor